MAEYLNQPPLITAYGVFKGDPNMESNSIQHGTFNFGDQSNCLPWYTTSCSNISPREQVQNEILLKVRDAINDDNIKRAKELLDLAQKLKEL